MRNYFEIADDYAREMFPDHEDIKDWYSFLNYYADKHVEWFGQYYMVLAKMYAQEVSQQALNNAAENAVIIDNDGFVGKEVYNYYDNLVFISKKSITDPKNIQL